MASALEIDQDQDEDEDVLLDAMIHDAERKRIAEVPLTPEMEEIRAEYLRLVRETD